MAKEKKSQKSTENKTGEFVPDLSVVQSSGLDEALKGLDEPVISDLEKDLDLGISTEPNYKESTEKKTRRPYTKRKRTEDETMDLLDGEEIQMIIDLVIPMAIVGIHNMVNKEKMSPDSVMLTSKQEEKMNKICQRVAERIKMSVNPFVALAVAGMACYGGNYLKNKP